MVNPEGLINPLLTGNVGGTAIEELMKEFEGLIICASGQCVREGYPTSASSTTQYCVIERT